MIEELKPCPFCAGSAYPNTTTHSCRDFVKLNEGQSVFHGVNCASCGFGSQGAWKTPEDAALRWNTRHGESEVAALKKEVEEKRLDVLSWGQKYERVLDELVGVKKERDALKKENEALKEENAKPEDGAARWRGK